MLLIRASGEMTGGRYEAAREQFAEVKALDPTDVDAWTGWGLASFHLGEHAKAAEAMRKAMPSIVSRGLHSTIPSLLAESYVFLGELDKARETLGAYLLEPDIEPALEVLKAKVARKLASE